MGGFIKAGATTAQVLARLRELTSQAGVKESESSEALTEPKCKKCNDNEGYVTKRPYLEVYPDDIAYVEQMQARGHTGPFLTELYVTCDCAAERDLERRFQFAEITKEMRELRFSNFHLHEVDDQIRSLHATAKAYSEAFPQIRHNRENSIYLCGNPGSGKTHLLMAVLNEFLQAGIKVLYFPFVEAMDELKSQMFNDSAEYNEKQRQLQRVPVLFIDDLFKPILGNDPPTKTELKFMYSIINYRYLNHLPTMISSELTLKKLLLIPFNEALVSRIIQMSKPFIYEIKGDPMKLNYRLRGLTS